MCLAEHRFQYEGYEVIPNLIMEAVHLSHLAEKLNIGCGFNVAPMWHPSRMAEDYAVAGILTNGRTIFDVACGYHTREVETFGAPILDQEANRELFEEQVEIILKAFHNERFSHKGKHYTLPPEVPYRGYMLKELMLVPRPVYRTHEIWQPVVSASSRAMDFMIEHARPERGANRRRWPSRRSGRGGRADAGALRETRFVVRGHGGRADRVSERT